jgi:hypothetical protein
MVAESWLTRPKLMCKMFADGGFLAFAINKKSALISWFMMATS